MSAETIHIPARDGYPLAVTHYLPEQSVQRAVLIASAMGVPQRFYTAFATWLSEQGVAVMTFDWRGMGASAPVNLRGFKASITDWAEQDLAAMMDAFCAKWSDVPRTYLGHSLGGQLFGWLDHSDRFDRVVTVASGNGYWRLNAPATRNLAPILWWFLAPVAITVAGYFPGKRLGTLGDLPAAAMWQWRRWCLHPDYLGSEGDAVRGRYAQVRTPITAVILDDDELLTAQGIRKLYRLYANANVHFEHLHPHEWGMKNIGHFGLFKPSSVSTLWPRALHWLAAEPVSP
ncbi:MAG: alpha/beta fold hydrolase [Aquabacterium sp.]|nr:alpha/beta fold hydrolase [Aquabacterium sp.]